jgi:hypothetical protein
MNIYFLLQQKKFQKQYSMSNIPFVFKKKNVIFLHIVQASNEDIKGY